MVFRGVERPVLSASPFLMIVSLKHTVHGPGFASLPASFPEGTNITAQAPSVLEGILKCYDLHFYGLRTYLQFYRNLYTLRSEDNCQRVVAY